MRANEELPRKAAAGNGGLLSGRVITALELERSYTPTREEMAWIRDKVRTPATDCV
jgi:hypothetical protein